MDLSRRQQIIEQAVKEAGDILIEKFETFDRSQVQLKAGKEIVTEYDLMSEKIILSAIKKNFPDDGILSEEAGANAKESDWLWAVDPIDGTTNFTMHNPLWCISVGLFFKKEVVLGIIYAPYTKELYLAVKGQGAKLNNKLIKVSQIKEGKPLNSFCWGRSHDQIVKMINYFKYQKLNGHGLRHLGSAAIELAYVAAGRLESFIVPDAKTWDVAAGALMVREAGGRVTDFNNNDWRIDSKDIMASNGLVHAQILQAIKAG